MPSSPGFNSHEYADLLGDNSDPTRATHIQLQENRLLSVLYMQGRTEPQWDLGGSISLYGDRHRRRATGQRQGVIRAAQKRPDQRDLGTTKSSLQPAIITRLGCGTGKRVYIWTARAGYGRLSLAIGPRWAWERAAYLHSPLFVVSRFFPSFTICSFPNICLSYGLVIKMAATLDTTVGQEDLPPIWQC